MRSMTPLSGMAASSGTNSVARWSSCPKGLDHTYGAAGGGRLYLYNGGYVKDGVRMHLACSMDELPVCGVMLLNIQQHFLIFLIVLQGH